MSCHPVLLLLLACQSAALIVTPRPALVSRTRGVTMVSRTRGVTMETKVEKLKAEGLDAIARREAAESSEAKYTPVPEQYIQEVSIPDPPPSEYGYEEYAYQRYKLPRPSDYGTSKTALGVTVVLAGAVAFLLRRLVSSIGI